MTILFSSYQEIFVARYITEVYANYPSLEANRSLKKSFTESILEIEGRERTIGVHKHEKVL
ncbi:hypothetical protein [Psychrobacillus sp. BL-248-WT-3]|uniref:hypothetical protein n=1 Tax=Psychrobacillus sp. BL-248-WT-3 TaxID=2725306 RepID=UPI00146EFD1F|nr:hypothetical protein [Psychrobacillus sp. BL-248-WT-3]MCM3360234.1 hypothetical protein [Psychrobacillus sp. MER TA 171]NME07218.1 hypothetical protein [Psychrobacillus sp. BL-248-WT-3]